MIFRRDFVKLSLAGGSAAAFGAVPPLGAERPNIVIASGGHVGRESLEYAYRRTVLANAQP
jgi:hypothetical protein